MRFESKAVLTGIKSSKGKIESSGMAFDSTTFHLQVDLADSTMGQTIGRVTRPFKCGDSTEINKWIGMKDKWPLAGIPVDCVFEMAAGAADSSKLVLVDIKPSPTQKAA